MNRKVGLYANLYSVQRFTSSVVDSCLRGEAVVILLPVWLGELDAWKITRPAFQARGVEACEVEVDFSKDPAEFLYRKVFDKPPPVPEEALDALVAKPWPDGKDVIYVRGLSGRPNDAAVWYEAAHDLTRRLAEQRQPGAPPHSVLLFNQLDRNNPQPPHSDLPFHVIWWFGMPSALDFRLLCRQVLDERKELEVVTGRWLEFIIPVLAGGDYNQIDRIVEAVESTDDNLEMHLDQFARDKHWDAETLLRSGADQFFRTPAHFAWVPLPDQPPPNVKLWADGALYATLEEGVRLHPAAVRLLGQKYSGKDKDRRNFRLNHMVWQAQNSLCYGLLNEARLILNEVIDDTETPDWTSRVKAVTVEREELSKSNLTCEIGHLRQLLDAGHLTVFQTSLRESVAKMNSVRKHLAHYQPLSLADLKQFVELLQTLPECLALCRRPPPPRSVDGPQS